MNSTADILAKTEILKWRYFYSNQVELNKINQTVGSTEDSHHLISEEFEKQKQKNSHLLKDNKKIRLDNTRLHQELKNMKSVARNDIEINRLVQ